MKYSIIKRLKKIVGADWVRTDELSRITTAPMF